MNACTLQMAESGAGPGAGAGAEAGTGGEGERQVREVRMRRIFVSVQCYKRVRCRKTAYTDGK